MKLCTCQIQQSQWLAVVSGDQLLLPGQDAGLADNPAFASLRNLVEAGEHALLELQGWLARAPEDCRLAMDEVEMLAPIPVPRQNIICLGWNYAEHAEESARAKRRDLKLPDQPIVFTKAVGSVTGPHADVTVDPEITQEFDWEVELGVIIARHGKNIPRQDALQHVFGYTVINDLSARDLQFRHKQFFIGKSLDGACPMGPVVVTRDEIDDPQALQLRSWVNGELKQDSSTRFQIFDVADIIHRLSQSMTLYPGDIIATGTPEGVGFARQPPEYLRHDDVVSCEIDGIGRLSNRIVNP